MEIIFPNVEDEGARPVRIMARTPSPLDPSHQARLTADEVNLLQLHDVSMALAALRLPETRFHRAWTIDWTTGDRPTLNGRSAQLAALVATVAAQRRTRVRPRGWLQGARLWFTGSLQVLEDPLEVLVEPVGEDADGRDALLAKFRAFSECDGSVFVCVAPDARALQGHAGHVRRTTASGLRALLRQQTAKSAKYLVALGPGDVRLLLDTLFHGVFPRSIGFWVANAVTASRFGLGVAVALAVVLNEPDAAAATYVVGILTDVADGVAARGLHGTSEFGIHFDRWADMTFHVFTVSACCTVALVAGRLVEVSMLLVGTVGLVLVTRLAGVRPASALAKLRSGVIRALLLVYFGWQLDWDNASAPWLILRAVTLVLLVAVAFFELRLIRDDVATSRRGWASSRDDHVVPP